MKRLVFLSYGLLLGLLAQLGCEGQGSSGDGKPSVLGVPSITDPTKPMTAAEASDRMTRCFDLAHKPEGESYRLLLAGKEYPIVEVAPEVLERHHSTTSTHLKEHGAPTHCAHNIEIPENRTALGHVIQTTNESGTGISSLHNHIEIPVYVFHVHPRHRKSKDNSVNKLALVGEGSAFNKAGVSEECPSPVVSPATVSCPGGDASCTITPAVVSPEAKDDCGVLGSEIPHDDQLTTITPAHQCVDLAMLHPSIMGRAQCASWHKKMYNIALARSTLLQNCVTALRQAQNRNPGNTYLLAGEDKTVTFERKIEGLNYFPKGNNPNKLCDWTNIPEGKPCTTVQKTTTYDREFQKALGLFQKDIINRIENSPDSKCKTFDNKVGHDVAPIRNDDGSISAKTKSLNGSAVIINKNSSATGLPSYTMNDSGNKRGIQCEFENNAADTSYVTLTCTNYYLRFLQLFVKFTKSDGKTVVPPENCDPSQDCARLFDWSPTDWKHVQLIMPNEAYAGVPNPKPGSSSWKFKIPAAATNMEIAIAGPGTIGKGDIKLIGVPLALTGLLNIALPVFLLSASITGEGLPPNALFNVMLKAFTGEGGDGGLLKFFLTIIASNGKDIDAPALMSAFAGGLLSFLTKPEIAPVAAIVTTEVAAEEGAQAAAGAASGGTALAAAKAAAIAIDAALIAVTAGEALSAPMQYNYTISRTNTWEVGINPDPFDQAYPAVATNYEVTAVLDDGQIQYADGSGPGKPFVLGASNKDLPNPAFPVTYNQGSLSVSTHRFTNLPAGGQVTFNTKFYSSNGWLAAMGTTGLMDNIESVPTYMTIKEFKVPMLPSTVYTHKQRLGRSEGTFAWMYAPGDAPNAKTPQAGISLLGNFSLSMSKPSDAYLAALTDPTKVIDVNDQKLPWVLGYTWADDGRSSLKNCENGSTGQGAVWNYQAINAVNPISAETRITGLCGTVGQQSVAYPSYLTNYSPAIPSVKQGFYLRQKDNTSGLGLPYTTQELIPLQENNCPAVGEFPSVVDELVIHPRRKAIGMNKENGKLFILDLPPLEVDEYGKVAGSGLCNTTVSQEIAETFGGLGKAVKNQENINYNLLYVPKAMTLAKDGTILVLENPGNKVRIHAFSVSGLAAGFFRQGFATNCPTGTSITQGEANIGSGMNIEGDKRFFAFQLCEHPDGVVKDFAIEDKGYIYVLWTDAAGTGNVDIYGPKGDFISGKTTGINAAQIEVDVWRSLYTLNYETFMSSTNQYQPTASMWIPSTPNSGEQAELAAAKAARKYK